MYIYVKNNNNISGLWKTETDKIKNKTKITNGSINTFMFHLMQ